MTSKDPESSFNRPRAYHSYAGAAIAAVQVYQRPRRPVMFHLLFVVPFFIAPFASWVIILPVLWPAIGWLRGCRILEDGFRENSEPHFTLSASWEFGGKGIREQLQGAKEELINLWWGKTWYFYLYLAVTPIAGYVHLCIEALRLLGDIFLLNCWDRWRDEVARNYDPFADSEHVRGQEMLSLPASSGSAPDSPPGFFSRSRQRLRGFHRSAVERGRQIRTASNPPSPNMPPIPDPSPPPSEPPAE